MNASSSPIPSTSPFQPETKRRRRMVTPKVEEIIDLESETPVFSTPGSSKRSVIDVDRIFRRAAMASSTFIDLDDDEDSEIRFLFSRPTTVFEIGESSNSKSKERIEIVESPEEETPIGLCEICADEKTSGEWFRIRGCSHRYCKDCTASYVAAKLQDNVTGIACPAPGCRSGELSPENCREILPPEVFERWGLALCEAAILASEKFVYCPYRDCSTMLVDDGEESVTETSCPSCHRMFCARCGVAWHAGIGCEEFRSLGEGEREREDVMLRILAKSKKWTRCPKCSFYVEKVSGCLLMKCRCGAGFCCNCGSDLISHYCTKCKH